MTGRLHLPHPHLPHPHIADEFLEHIGEGFWAGMFHQRPAPIVPDGHDWNEWHWDDSRRDADYEHRGGGGNGWV